MLQRCFAIILLLAVFFAASWCPAAEPGKPQSDRDNDYELYKLFVDSLDQVQQNYVSEMDRRELIEAAIRGMMEKLDPYSSYVGPNDIEQLRTTVESEFGGIGIQITMDNGALKILSPIYGTPAYKAGLLAGDRIVEINDKSTDNLSLDEATGRLKGKEDTSLTLTVIHPGADNKEKITITRKRIHVETVLGDRRKDDGQWDFMFDQKLRIGYVRLTAFSRNTSAELQRALEQLQTAGMRGLILDLRFNPGGLLNTAIEVSDLFVSEGNIVGTKGRSASKRSWEAHKAGTFENVPLAVLINRYSASASEIVAACLQDHKRAAIMGERTWGKGSVQSLIELEDGKSALKLTTATYFRPSGKNIHRFPEAKDQSEWGVSPDNGFDLKLSQKEMSELILDRHARDILRAGNGAKINQSGQNDKGLIDRQLQMAVKYLGNELGKTREELGSR